ncbi:thrombospondin type 3 repeat-containing protein [Aquirufa ecclesiirivi]|uniref:thrombospondin type 3 repeat-containing protein n=1 Tax=Aquirufa ecclesiirivi TaxID=2715124 RepID=UPI0014078465|nr:thrombospondin type 3 repeat-containing protein [Aquirufa ecclesiirivi]NHC47710.1 T9SS type A sorting domain-containing protein [Aquirufa ecclesiirivi]
MKIALNSGIIFSIITFSLVSRLILAQDLPKVKIQIGNNGIGEQYGKTLITAELSTPSAKDVIIDFNVTGTATYDKDYSINFLTKNQVKIVAGGNGIGNNSNQLPYGGKMFIDDEKTIYVSDTRNQRVQKWTYGSTAGSTIAGGNIYGGTPFGSRPDQFNGLGGIYVDSEKNLYACDASNFRIQKWSPGATSGITIAGGNGSGYGSNQIRPSDLKLDSEGNLIILDRILGTADFRIQKWNKNATSATTLVDFTNNNKFYVTGFYYDESTGDIYLTGDLAPVINYAVIRCPKNNPQNWEVVAGGNGFGNDLNQLNLAIGVQLSRNNLFISDFRGHSVIKWALGAKIGEVVMGTRGVSGKTLGFLSLPNGIFIDKYENIYIGDEGSNSIQVKQIQPQIVIPAGKTSASIELFSIDDTSIEGPDEIIKLNISSFLNCQIENDSLFKITIQENDFPDTDKDQISDHLDNCPTIYNPDQKDVDKDSIGDVCDDSDGDGITDDKDDCPNTEKGKPVDKNGCSISQRDSDEDGFMDDKDLCPNTIKGQSVDKNGCALSQKDTDGDGVFDDKDKCSETQTGKKVDLDGCADYQRDTDGDGITDDKDDCPTIKNPSKPLINKLTDLELASSAGNAYQWYLDGKLIAGADKAFLKVSSAGVYSVQLKDEKGCKSPMSDSVIILITGTEEENKGISIYPNPTDGVINIQTTFNFENIGSIQISDIRGSIIKQFKLNSKNQVMDLSDYPIGVYLLVVTINGEKHIYKIQKR